MLGLRLLADGKVEPILRKLAQAPSQPYELERQLVSFPHATLMSRLLWLEEVGAISRDRRGGVPPRVSCELTPSGGDLLELLDASAAWLTRGPAARQDADAAEAAAIASALADGWGSGILRELALGPRHGTQLDERIHGLSHHQIALRLNKLVNAGLVARSASRGRRLPYAVTRWGREAVGVLARAARWEHRHSPPGTEPPLPADVADGLLLAAPLVALPEQVDGVCALTIQCNGGVARARGVWATVEGGRVVSAALVPADRADAWARGTVSDWFETLVERRGGLLNVGGDSGLARALIAGLRVPLLRR